MQTVTHHADNYHDWMEREATEAYIADQRRYAPVTAPVTTHYADETGRVLLGQRTITDEQYAADEAAGGLVAMACGYSQKGA